MKKFLGVILTASMVMSSFTPVLAQEQNKNKVDRLNGSDRYETSAKISRRTFPNHIEKIVLASGENLQIVWLQEALQTRKMHQYY